MLPEIIVVQIKLGVPTVKNGLYDHVENYPQQNKSSRTNVARINGCTVFAYKFMYFIYAVFVCINGTKRTIYEITYPKEMIGKNNEKVCDTSSPA